MRFVTVRYFRGNAARVWRELPAAGEMIITSNGRPMAMLAAVDESNVERAVTAWRRARAMQALADLQTASAQKGLAGLRTSEIDAEIRAVRRARKRSVPHS